MTEIATNLPESDLLQALRAAIEEHHSDDGWTLIELCQLLHGRVTPDKRTSVSRTLAPLLANKSWVRGWRKVERIDGKLMPIAVFRPS